MYFFPLISIVELANGSFADPNTLPVIEDSTFLTVIGSCVSITSVISLSFLQEERMD